ncbi:S41 family peptidase [Mucilaginibacter angelicae]|uniref:S41 family peptidase n=1 Tax=Mucilaginibacter angelicae TaxID=869718 RepID=A0ABV6L245_9SPHI
MATTIDHPLNEIEFWQILQNIVVKIGSGHTTIVPSSSSVNHYNALSHEVLPFLIYIQKDKLYLKRFINKTDSSFRVGDEILRINGEKSYSLLMRIRNLCSGDGLSNSFKDYRLQQGAFNQIYNILYGDLSSFDVVYKSGTEIKTKTVQAATIQSNMSLDLSTTKNQYHSIYSLPQLQQTDSVNAKHTVLYSTNSPYTAILKINEFDYKDFKVFHEQVFRSLKNRNIKNLILDLRGNPGGYDRICIDLMKYLLGKNFYFSPAEEGHTNINIAMKTIDNPDFHSADTTLITYSPYKIINQENKLQSPYKNTFSGSLYLIVDGGTFSAASLLAVAIKDQRKNTFVVGRETGGNKSGSDGGQILSVTLPNTRFQLIIPLLWAYSVDKQENNGYGLKPDIEIVYSAMDVYNFLAKKGDADIFRIESEINLINTPPVVH